MVRLSACICKREQRFERRSPLAGGVVSFETQRTSAARSGPGPMKTGQNLDSDMSASFEPDGH